MEALPPLSFAQWLSAHMILSEGSSSREGTSTGRSPASNVRSAVRAARLAERTEANVPTASTSVAPAVASDEMVAQSVMPQSLPEPADLADLRVRGDDRGEQVPGGLTGHASLRSSTQVVVEETGTCGRGEFVESCPVRQVRGATHPVRRRERST